MNASKHIIYLLLLVAVLCALLGCNKELTVISNDTIQYAGVTHHISTTIATPNVIIHKDTAYIDTLTVSYNVSNKIVFNTNSLHAIFDKNTSNKYQFQLMNGDIIKARISSIDSAVFTKEVWDARPSGRWQELTDFKGNIL